jgi:ABC-type transport system substrate-binding protein
MHLARRWLVLAVASAVVGAGCSGSTGAGALAPTDRVRFTIAADPQTLDPLFAHADANGEEGQLARLAFEPFIDVDARGRAVPVLLDRIPSRSNGGISADGTVITYHLRAGVRWQDGVPVSARDVVWTLHAILDPHNAVRSRAGYERRSSMRSPCASRCARPGRRPSRRCSATARRRSTCCPRTFWRASATSRRARSGRSRSVTARIVSLRGGAANG